MVNPAGFKNLSGLFKKPKPGIAGLFACVTPLLSTPQKDEKHRLALSWIVKSKKQASNKKKQLRFLVNTNYFKLRF